MAEKVLGLLQTNSRPYSVQNLVDLLACQGLKKAQIQKALDALVASGDVTGKVRAPRGMQALAP